MRCNILACALAVLVMNLPPASAGTMTMMANAVARYDPVSFNELPIVFLADGSVANGQPGLYQVDLTFIAQNAPGDKGWANTLFSSMARGRGLSFYLDSWIPADSAVEQPFGGTYLIYSTNQDAGPDPTDLQQIIVSISGANIPASDIRNKTGTLFAHGQVGYPSLLGSLLVLWDGVGRAELLITDHTYSFTTLQNTFGPVVEGAGAVAGFGAIPEPSSLRLLGVTVFVATICVRRGCR